jgi:hypothetical protein
VRINGIVHLKTRLPADAVVPIGWVAVGDPAVSCLSRSPEGRGGPPSTVATLAARAARFSCRYPTWV